MDKYGKSAIASFFNCMLLALTWTDLHVSHEMKIPKHTRTLSFVNDITDHFAAEYYAVSIS